MYKLFTLNESSISYRFLAIFSGHILHSMTHIGIDGDAFFAQIAIVGRPRFEVNVDQRNELIRISHLFFGDVAAVCYNGCTDDIRSDGTRGFDHFLNGTSRRRKIVDNKNVLTLDHCVVAAFDDKAAIAILVCIESVYLASGDVPEMVCGPLGK